MGIDIGGTKISTGVITASGDVLERAQAPTPARLGPSRVLQEAIQIAATLLDGREISAVGVGAAGVIDPETGRVTSATDTITDWAGTDIAHAMREAFGVEVVVRNDAHAHAVGEAVFGAGAGHSTVLLVAAGTGIGGALVVDGSPLIGAHGAAGHLGHIPSQEADGLRCSCGILGHVEAISSGPGLARLYRHLGGGADTASAPDVLRRVKDDPVARHAVTLSAHALGAAIGGLVNVADPGVVVIAGGLQDAGDPWWRPLLQGVRSTALPALASVPVVPAALGQDAAIIGAATIAIRLRRPQC
ncbi:MAG: ROK family protein [Microbacteriaceae bacterium]|nr:MAG: ROK family protein [Microbacteriaceae bacterium]